MSILQKLAPTRQAEAGRERRRAYPVHMYCGRNGAGKTGGMIYDTIPDLEAGKTVLSTVRLLDYKNPRPCDDDNCEDVMHGNASHMAAHPLWVPFTDWPQLLDWHNGPVLMDEITGIADSNESASMPNMIANRLGQLRRYDCTVRLTGLNFIRANKRIREAVNAVTRCESYFPVTSYGEDGSALMWKQRRMAKYRTYDAQTLPVDDHTDASYEKADHISTSTLWLPTSVAVRAYDTLAPVLMVGTVSDAGRCAHCAGNRRTPECSCPDYQEAKAASRPPARSGRRPEGSRTDSGFEPDLRGVATSSRVRLGV